METEDSSEAEELLNRWPSTSRQRWWSYQSSLHSPKTQFHQSLTPLAVQVTCLLCVNSNSVVSFVCISLSRRSIRFTDVSYIGVKKKKIPKLFALFNNEAIFVIPVTVSIVIAFSVRCLQKEFPLPSSKLRVINIYSRDDDDDDNLFKLISIAIIIC